MVAQSDKRLFVGSIHTISDQDHDCHCQLIQIWSNIEHIGSGLALSQTLCTRSEEKHFPLSLKIMQQVDIVVSCWQLECWTYENPLVHMGGVGSGQVRFLSAISGRVNISPGRVQEKWPVDNSAVGFKRHTLPKISVCMYVIHRLLLPNSVVITLKSTCSHNFDSVFVRQSSTEFYRILPNLKKVENSRIFTNFKTTRTEFSIYDRE